MKTGSAQIKIDDTYFTVPREVMLRILNHAFNTIDKLQSSDTENRDAKVICAAILLQHGMRRQ